MGISLWILSSKLGSIPILEQFISDLNKQTVQPLEVVLDSRIEYSGDFPFKRYSKHSDCLGDIISFINLGSYMHPQRLELIEKVFLMNVNTTIVYHLTQEKKCIERFDGYNLSQDIHQKNSSVRNNGNLNFEDFLTITFPLVSLTEQIELPTKRTNKLIDFSHPYSLDLKSSSSSNISFVAPSEFQTNGLYAQPRFAPKKKKGKQIKF